MQPRRSNASVAKPNPNHVPPAESSDSTMNAVLAQTTIDRVQRRCESSDPVNRARVQLRSVVLTVLHGHVPSSSYPSSGSGWQKYEHDGARSIPAVSVLGE